MSLLLFPISRLEERSFTLSKQINSWGMKKKKVTYCTLYKCQSFTVKLCNSLEDGTLVFASVLSPRSFLTHPPHHHPGVRRRNHILGSSCPLVIIVSFLRKQVSPAKSISVRKTPPPGWSSYDIWASASANKPRSSSHYEFHSSLLPSQSSSMIAIASSLPQY